MKSYNISVNTSIIIFNTLIFFLGTYLLSFGYPYYESFILFEMDSPFYKHHQWITYMFTHANLTHLFFNMFLLFLFGDELEKLFGKVRYLLFYLSCGVISVIFYMMTITTSSPILGASGAVFGVLTLYTLLNPNEKINLLFLLPIKIKYIFSIYLLSETFAALGEYDGVAHTAHIGGALGGFMTYLVIKYVLNNK